MPHRVGIPPSIRAGVPPFTSFHVNPRIVAFEKTESIGIHPARIIERHCSGNSKEPCAIRVRRSIPKIGRVRIPGDDARGETSSSQENHKKGLDCILHGVFSLHTIRVMDTARNSAFIWRQKWGDAPSHHREEGFRIPSGIPDPQCGKSGRHGSPQGRSSRDS